MSPVEQARSLVQDVAVPDLKAISARMHAVEALWKQGFEGVNKRFETIERRSEAVEPMAARCHDAVLGRFGGAIASANADHEATLKAVNMDRRMEQMALTVAAQSTVSFG